jgi:hypothetical protein
MIGFHWVPGDLPCLVDGDLLAGEAYTLEHTAAEERTAAGAKELRTMLAFDERSR